jgi:hypothetical protein
MHQIDASKETSKSSIAIYLILILSQTRCTVKLSDQVSSKCNISKYFK